MRMSCCGCWGSSRSSWCGASMMDGAHPPAVVPRLPPQAGGAASGADNPHGTGVASVCAPWGASSLEALHESATDQFLVKLRRVVALSPHQPEPIRILHLSDLHLGPNDDPSVRLRPLVRGSQDKEDGLGFDHTDYLVMSGDLTNRASVEEFEKVYQFISALITRLKITAARCMIVPGNHDLSWDHEVYEWRQERRVDVGKLQAGSYVKQADGFIVWDDERYDAQFEHFGKFYHSLIQEPYQPKAGI
jgi:Calcineurin-like phosphoesterase